MCRKCFPYTSYFQKNIVGIVFKSINKGSYGSKTTEIMKIKVFGLSNNEIEKLLIQNEAEEFPSAFVPIFFTNLL